MRDIEVKIPMHKNVEDFLYHCKQISKSPRPRFRQSEARLLYDLAGMSIEEKYKECNQRIPRQIKITESQMKSILERITERNPYILYN